MIIELYNTIDTRLYYYVHFQLLLLLFRVCVCARARTLHFYIEFNKQHTQKCLHY